MVTERSGILAIQSSHNGRARGLLVGGLDLSHLAINHLTSSRGDLSGFEIVANGQQSQPATRSHSPSPEDGASTSARMTRSMTKCGICKEIGHDRKNSARNVGVITAYCTW
jgi:hypothetical protein